MEDLVVTARRTRLKLTPAEVEHCDPYTLRERGREYVLVFLFDGETFRPAPKTAKAVALFQ